MARRKGPALHVSRRWLPGWPRMPVLVLFTLVALGLVGGVLLILSTIRAERAERLQATRTERIVTILRDISRAATNAETGQRGYFITLDQRYLAPYVAARAQVEPLLGQLHQRVMQDEDASRQLMSDEIAVTARARFAELDETVAQIARGDMLDARRRILTDEGQRLMERLRTQVSELEALEVNELDQARSASIAAENRIVPLLSMLLGLIITGLALGLWQVFRTAEVEATAAQAEQLRAARDRADLLARELNHRVKNLFAVVLAIVRMSGRESPEGREVINRVAGRIEALTKAHAVTQGAARYRTARLGELVETALAPYRSDESRCDISGPEVDLPERAVVPVGLMLHEMATNAVKYGAWSAPGGRIAVSWQCDDGDPQVLRLTWREHCAQVLVTPEDRGQGHGSVMVDSAARQLEGAISRSFHPDGIEQELTFPLPALA